MGWGAAEGSLLLRFDIEETWKLRILKKSLKDGKRKSTLFR